MRVSLALFALAGALQLTGAPAARTVTIKGYVIDSACTLTQHLKKPISVECAEACAKAGSPLVILTGAGVIYWPTAATMPAPGQNEKLLPFAGKRVTATGKLYDYGGSKGIVIEKIQAEK